MSKDEIIENIRPHRLHKASVFPLSSAFRGNCKGIYFLFDGDELVYIGSSRVNIFQRLKSHVKDKKWDYFIFYQTRPETDVLGLEYDLIRKLNPKLNIAR